MLRQGPPATHRSNEAHTCTVIIYHLVLGQNHMITSDALTHTYTVSKQVLPIAKKKKKTPIRKYTRNRQLSYGRTLQLKDK